jgi:uncharacterized RDD family membrane protein YckC
VTGMPPSSPGLPPAPPPPPSSPPSYPPQFPYAGGAPQWPQAYAPVKPGPAPGLEYAGFWIRFVSYLIDVIPIGVVGAVLNVSTGTGIHCTGISGATTVCTAGTGSLGSWLGFLVLGTYWTLTWSLLGASLGQKALGLRVVNAADGQRIDIGKAVLRYIGFVISIIPFALGLIWAAFDMRKQGWHDKIAGTYVVREY